CRRRSGRRRTRASTRKCCRRARPDARGRSGVADGRATHPRGTAARRGNDSDHGPAGMAPCPVVTPSTVVLAMNRLGRYGDHTSMVPVLDRRTGKELLAADGGGVGVWQTVYAGPADGLVVTAAGGGRGGGADENVRGGPAHTGPA